MSYPYQAHLDRAPGIHFYANETNAISVLIWPNASGKSGFLEIIKQVFKWVVVRDYVCDTTALSDPMTYHRAIVYHPYTCTGLRPHIASPKKTSRVILTVRLTQADYDNMRYIAKHAPLFNDLIKKYSTIDVQYPLWDFEKIDMLPSTFVLDCTIDTLTQDIILTDAHFTEEQQFVLSYFRTLELVQICIDMYNAYQRSQEASPLLSLKHTVAFIGTQRSLSHISHRVDPYARNSFVSWAYAADQYMYTWFYLCAKKIWNIISDNFTLKMSKKDIANYPQKLESSEFFVSLSFVINKYFNRLLQVEYTDGLLVFWLVDAFGNYGTFADLSDGEQSLLSMIFTIYGYDLKDGLLFVDEPEIHFHPQMQRSFARMIEKINQNIGTQFIVLTYSPFLINESNINHVYRFSKTQGMTSVQHAPLSLSPDESSLVHLLKFENLSKIFFVNNIIMVEWETDAYFFDFYLKYLHTLPERKNKLTDYEIININGKWSYKIWHKFLSKFGLKTYFIGDWDNVVDYGFMTQNDLSNYYKQARLYYAWLKKSGKTHRHYNKLVDTIRNVFPKQYRKLVAHIDELYQKNVFILKKWDIETYLGMPEKGLENTVKFCHHNFASWFSNTQFDACRQEFAEILQRIFR